MARLHLNEIMIRHIARAAGLGAVMMPMAYACGGIAVVDEGSGGATASSNQSNQSSSDSTNGSTVVTNGQVSSSSGGNCTETTTSVSSGGFGTYHYTLCLDTLNTPCPADENTAADLITTILGQECCVNGLNCEYLNEVVCGPYASMGNSCCFEITTQSEGCVTPGRPYRHGHGPVTAAAVSTPGWTAGEGTPDLDGLDGGLSHTAREALRTLWTEHALGEHASVASFARLSLELMALGAPAALLAEVHRAARDEVRHAQLAFTLATAFGTPGSEADQPLGPGPLSLHGTTAPSLAELAAATVAEGCVNETLCAMLLAEQLEQATHPAVREVLAAMLEDETRHVELSWRIVAWALQRGDAAVRDAVAEAFADATVPAAPLHDLQGDALALAPIGPPAAAQRRMRQALAEVVRPCASALLATASGDRTRSRAEPATSRPAPSR